MSIVLEGCWRCFILRCLIPVYAGMYHLVLNPTASSSRRENLAQKMLPIRTSSREHIIGRRGSCVFRAKPNMSPQACRRTQTAVVLASRRPPGGGGGKGMLPEPPPRVD